MRSRFFHAVLLCSFGLAAAACAAPTDDGTTGLVTKKDSGVDGSSTTKDSGSTQPDTSVTNPPTDSGSSTLPPPVDDTGTTPDDTNVTPPDDSGSPVTDTGTGVVDTYVPPTGGTTGLACTSSTTCGSAGNKCVAFPAPVCAGAPCTDPTDTSSASGYADYSPCDSDSGVCSPDTTLNDGTGYCVPQCSVPFGGGAASGCLAGDTCIVQILDPSGTSAIGSCEGGSCTTDAQCAAVSSTYTKCQKETLNCVQPTDYKTFGANGAACTLSTSGTSSPYCVCLAANPTSASTKGYCSDLCITGDAAHGCPTGYTCDPLLSTTYFTAIPSGVSGYCAKNCTTSCPTGTTCQSFGGTKVCAP